MMAQPEKKITFGFSKVAKKTNLILPLSSTKEKSTDKQFIDGIEENSIKLRNGEEEEKKAALVIPLVGPRKSSTLISGKSIAEIAEDFSEVGKTKTEIQEPITEGLGSTISLETLAVKEILQEASGIKSEENKSLEALPTLNSVNREALQRESTLDDYENVPVSQFGLAMLRGMGWKPGEGIGKNKKSAPVSVPEVRPKGLGLGADKVAANSTPPLRASSGEKNEDDLKVAKGACVKIVSGSRKGQYAQIEGFTDDSGRVIIKLAIGGHSVSVAEASINPVAKSEYIKFSKVLNADKFEEFKKKNEGGGGTSGMSSSDTLQQLNRNSLVSGQSKYASSPKSELSDSQKSLTHPLFQKKQEKKLEFSPESSDSEEDTKRRKKKNKSRSSSSKRHRRNRYSSSDSEGIPSQRSSKHKKKSKKSRRSHSRSPSNVRRRQ